MIRTTIALSLLILAFSANGAETRFYNAKGQYAGRAIENHGRVNYFDSKERLVGRSTNNRPEIPKGLPVPQSKFYKQGKVNHGK